MPDRRSRGWYRPPKRTVAKRDFVCDPDKYCKGVVCCDTKRSPPLTVGDYFRLGEHTGKSMEQIWDEDGDVHLRYLNKQPGVFRIELALLTDPCRYLQNARCTVYNSRPMSCAAFPFAWASLKEQVSPKETDMFGCMKNARITAGQWEFFEQLKKIMIEEDGLERLYFWEQGSEGIFIPNRGVFFSHMAAALKSQKTRDNGKESHRTRRLLDSYNKMSAALQDNTYKKMSHWEFVDLIRPVAYSLHYDRIREKFTSLSEEARTEYRKTSEQVREIYASQPSWGALAGSQPLVQIVTG
jgi:Fe-S-cluster containining protein